jgi:hypothetical protein
MSYLRQLHAIDAALAESNKTPFERALAEVQSVAPTLSMINGRYFLDDSPLTPRQVEAIYFAVVQKKPELVRTMTLEIFRKAVHAIAARNPAKEDPMLAPVKAIVAGALGDVNAGRPPVTDAIELGSMIILKRGRPTYVVTHRRLKNELMSQGFRAGGVEGTSRLCAIMVGMGWKVASLRVEELRQRCFIRPAPPDAQPTWTADPSYSGVMLSGARSSNSSRT